MCIYTQIPTYSEKKDELPKGRPVHALTLMAYLMMTSNMLLYICAYLHHAMAECHIYIYIYVCIYIYICMYVSIYTHTNTHIHTHTYRHTYIHTHTCAHMHMYMRILAECHGRLPVRVWTACGCSHTDRHTL